MLQCRGMLRITRWRWRCTHSRRVAAHPTSPHRLGVVHSSSPSYNHVSSSSQLHRQQYPTIEQQQPPSVPFTFANGTGPYVFAPSEEDASLPPASLVSPVLPPPSFVSSVCRWIPGLSVLVIGWAMECVPLLVWRLIRAANPNSSQLSSVSSTLLAIAYDLRSQYCYWFLRCFSIKLTVMLHKQIDNSTLNQRTTDKQQESNIPKLFVQCNQTSLLDAICFHAAAVVSKQQQASSPSLSLTPHLFINVGWGLLPFIGWVHAMTAVTVLPAWKAQARRGLDRMIHRMRLYGDSFYGSPEGHRARTAPVLAPYKNGLAIAAIQSGATVIPVIMKGAYQAMAKGEWKIRRTHIIVQFHQSDNNINLTHARPIPVRSLSLTYNDRHRLTQQIRSVYEQELTSDQQHASSELMQRAAQHTI